MDLPPNQLRTFLTVARRLSFTRAAEELHLTQPAVSTHIRKLERAVGTPLFEHIGRRVGLTPTGEVLCEYAERILGLEDEMRAALADANDLGQGELVFGTSTTIGISVLPNLLRRFRAQYPRVRMRIRVGMSGEMINELLEGQLDMALISGDHDDRLESVPIFEDELILIVPPSHRWAAVESIGPADLAGEPLLITGRGATGRTFLEEQLAAAGATVDVVAESNSHIAIARMVEAGVGVGMVLKYAVLEELEMGRLWQVPLRGVDLRRTVKLIVHRDKHFTPAMRAFQNLVLETTSAAPA
jgi:LysR family transcriptional regulator, transcriptional activator of the cysJI operon